MFGAYRTSLAMMVVMLHYANLAYIGNYAVFGFFALSGYLMTFIMQKNYGYTMHGLGAYALNRFLRIYPLYWMSCLVAIAILLFLDTEYTARNPAFAMPETFVQWGKNLGLTLRFTTRPMLIVPAWALTVELFFYICIGLGASRNKLISAVWFSLSVSYTAYLIASGASFGERYQTLGAASLPFSTGAMIFHWRDELRRLFGPIAEYSYAPALLFMLIIANWMVAKLSGGLLQWGFYSNYILCAIMIISLFHRKQLPFISRKWDSWMGDLSYPLYLLHFPLGFLFLYCFNRIGFDFAEPEMAFFLVATPFLLLAAWAMAVGVEQRVELLRNWVKQSLPDKSV